MRPLQHVGDPFSLRTPLAGFRSLRCRFGGLARLRLPGSCFLGRGKGLREFLRLGDSCGLGLSGSLSAPFGFGTPFGLSTLLGFRSLRCRLGSLARLHLPGSCFLGRGKGLRELLRLSDSCGLGLSGSLSAPLGFGTPPGIYLTFSVDRGARPHGYFCDRIRVSCRLRGIRPRSHRGSRTNQLGAQALDKGLLTRRTRLEGR